MRKAARSNHPIACRYIGRAHLLGQGTSRNIDLGQNWLLKAANQGDAYSMFDLAKSMDDERIVEKLIEGNYIPTLQNSTQIEREKTYLNSRFDFTGTDENGKKFILEVKNSPCADYEDISHKERKGKDYTSWSYDSKIAYFPDGYRKNVKDTGLGSFGAGYPS